MKRQAENIDVELSQEKEKNVKNIVSAVTKKKPSCPIKTSGKQNDSSEDVPCSEYLQMVKSKRKKNRTKLQDLGLIENTPTPKKKKGTKRISSPSNERQSPAARRKLTSPRKTKSVVEKCPYDHSFYSTSYNEEKDKRYLDKKYDLFGVKCQGCEKSFTKIEKTNTITPTNAAPMYVCCGRTKHKCVHSFCFACYQTRFIEHNPRRRRTVRKI